MIGVRGSIALRGLVVAALTVVGLTGASAPAQAAACTRGTGVTVVVNSSVSCVNSAGGNAYSMFQAAGHQMRDMQQQPGFVCQIDGAPAGHPCVRPGTGAYWALFWSNGTSGSWTYSQSGVRSLSIPDGGWVAFVYQSSTSPPGVNPIGPAPATRPAPKPKPKPTASASKSSATPTPTPSASAKGEEKKSMSSPSASATDDASAGSEQVRRTGQEVDDSGSSTLWWAGGAIALMLAIGLVTTVLQRRGKES